jgi:CHRD domain
MTRKVLVPAIGIASLLSIALMTLTTVALAGEHRARIQRAFALLEPTEEVPALSSPARGRFKATLDKTNQTIAYELSYEGLEAAPTQAHIHIGQRGANGGISLFLCGNPPTVPPAQFPQPPACPPAPATITGVLTAANVVGPALQGIDPTSSTANEFDAIIDLLRDGLTYANLHTTRFPAGEIRGQVDVEGRK